MNKSSKSSKYAELGVDVNKNETIVSSIKKDIETTYEKDLLKNPIFKFGNFSGILPFPQEILNNMNKKTPVLVSTMDGVGSKVELVKKIKGNEGFKSLGFDIVNHCCNDLLCGGGIPFCFLDYFASSNINIDEIEQFIKGICNACNVNSIKYEHKITVVGGESAEMPDTYQKNKTDLVGCMMGYNFQEDLEDRINNSIIEGDIIIGYKSNGPHTNGYTLIRKAIESDKFKELSKPDQQYILEKCCNSHLSYVPIFQELDNNNIKYKRAVHITGGGWIHNPPRVIPSNLKPIYYFEKYLNELIPDKRFWFLIKEITESSYDEMFETFNFGIGLMIIISNDEFKQHKDILLNNNLGIKIGEIITNSINV